MQLVAYGAQDIYLTGNPQITFFKVVYRRHTNFSMETIQQTIQGASTADGGNGTVTISRNGDLVTKVYVTSTTTGINNGDDIISEVELEIGGQLIDRHYKEWNQIWAELTTPESKSHGFKAMTGSITHSWAATGTAGVNMVQLPLNFWFCRNPGLALPLIALQYHEVKLKFTWGSEASAALLVWVDYIYLDTDERRRFAQVSHEYLIEQVQKQSLANKTTNKLIFNHPVKELIWTSPAANAYATAQLKLNGHDRFAAQEEEYFQLRQPFDYHTSIPGGNIPIYEHSRPLTPHLPVGKSDLTTPITFNIDNSSILLGVVDIAVAAGTNPVIGDIITVWEEFPLSVSPPVMITHGLNPSTGSTPDQDGEFQILASAASNLKIYTTTAADLIGPNGGPLQVGDQLSLTYPVAAGEYNMKTVEIGAIVTPPADTAVAVYSVIFVHGIGTDHTPTASVDGDGSVIFESRKSFMKRGSGTVSAVATPGTDFTIDNIYITVNHNFKMEITASYSRHDLLRPLSRCSQFANKINVYCFALKPEEHQPSGTCNFSRIDNAQLVTGVALATTDNIYAVNYNVLRIMSGMGGLAYSN